MQRAYDEVRKAATYNKFVRKLESANEKPQTSDMVKSDSWSSLPVERLLQQPVYGQKSATEKSYVQLHDASEI